MKFMNFNTSFLCPLHLFNHLPMHSRSVFSRIGVVPARQSIFRVSLRGPLDPKNLLRLFLGDNLQRLKYPLVLWCFLSPTLLIKAANGHPPN